MSIHKAWRVMSPYLLTHSVYAMLMRDAMTFLSDTGEKSSMT